jgi:hypothetical protein
MSAPDRIWAWWFSASKRNAHMQGGWSMHSDRREKSYLLSTPVREAAPDLLDALQDMLAANGSCDDDNIDAVDKARAAIAKATGGAA